MKIDYLSADETDIAPILEQSKALIERYEDFGSIDREMVFAWITRKMQNCIGEYTRILCDGETAGWIRAHEEGERLELDDLFILPRFQNRGIGTATLQKFIRESGKTISFYVFSRNVGAVRLYERLGFRATETVSHTRHIMERRAEQA